MSKKIGILTIILSLFFYSLICCCDERISEAAIISPQTEHSDSDNHLNTSHDPAHQGSHSHAQGGCDCQKIFNATNQLYDSQIISLTFSFLKYSSPFFGIYEDSLGKDSTTIFLYHGPPAINSSTISLYLCNSVLRI